jgi:hypothetical protein
LGIGGDGLVADHGGEHSTLSLAGLHAATSLASEKMQAIEKANTALAGTAILRIMSNANAARVGSINNAKQECQA